MLLVRPNPTVWAIFEEGQHPDCPMKTKNKIDSPYASQKQNKKCFQTDFKAEFRGVLQCKVHKLRARPFTLRTTRFWSVDLCLSEHLPVSKLSKNTKLILFDQFYPKKPLVWKDRTIFSDSKCLQVNRHFGHFDVNRT